LHQIKESTRKPIALLATAMQGEDEAVKIPMLEKLLYWTVSEGSRTETCSQAHAALLFFIGGDK